MTRFGERPGVKGLMLLGAALMAFGASPAQAIEGPGDWGHPLNAAGAVPAGQKVHWYPRIFCNPLPSIQPTPDISGCRITPNMKIDIAAQSVGARFLNDVAQKPSDGTATPPSFDLNLHSPGVPTPAKVGNCTVESTTKIFCKTNVEMPTVAHGAYLQTAKSVLGISARKTCVPSFQIWWHEPHGEPQRGQVPPAVPPYNGNNDLWGKNDFLTISTMGRC
ncbi:hypothetical protein [Streptomyces lavendulocolor]|uniref:hypothetical protein n=1 Tax=Streptomyces lavendulocolor TaxID=67316 RepID=UPI0033C7AE37